MSQIQGKQIADGSINLEKIKGGSKILPEDAVFGTLKNASQITDSNEFTTKSYVDVTVSDNISNVLSNIIEHESTSGSTSGAGVVSYSIDFDFSGTKVAKTNAKIFINGIKINTPEAAFFSNSTTGTRREQPNPGDKLYFDIDIVGYNIEFDDLIQITYYN
jgi:hypothetical protein